MELTNNIVIHKANEIGFDLVGFAHAEDLTTEIEHLKEWLDRGYHHKMKYMERNFDKRRNILTVFEQARSVISFAINYYTGEKYSEDKSQGKISKYAWGRDYHLIILEKIFELMEDLREIDPTFEAVGYVDTGPVMDKAWAVRGGIGWMGKHTNIISREYGSWIFLATMICNKDFDYALPSQDFCGTCSACIDACPTNAITEEYVLDANKCISNLTIENRGDIPEQFKGKFGNWLFGCDICQDVCPWNKKFSQISQAKEFYPNENKEISLKDVSDMTKNVFSKRFLESPIKRARLKGLKRNALFLSSD